MADETCLRVAHEAFHESSGSPMRWLGVGHHRLSVVSFVLTALSASVAGGVAAS